MQSSTRNLLYKGLVGAALLFYAWGLGALWFAHEWNIPEDTFFFVGILPVIAGVLLMVGALQVRSDLIAEDEAEAQHDDTTPAPEPGTDRR
jgi:hypothetical protein